MKTNRITVAFVLLAAVTSVGAWAIDGSPRCTSCGCHQDQGKLNRESFTKPILVTEQRVRTRVIMKDVEREEEYTVFRRVPKERKITQDRWYLEDEVRQQEVEKKTPVLVNLEVESVRKIQVPVRVESHPDDPELACKTPQLVLETVDKSESRTRTDVVFPSVKRIVDYCRKTPKKQTIEKATETVYTLQPVTLKRTKTVCVPEIVQETYEVKVWKEMECERWECEKCLGQHK